MRRLSLQILLTTCTLLLGGCAVRGDPWICNDYRSAYNCIGGPYLPGGHQGIDFGADAGTEVISATYGTIVSMRSDQCSGFEIRVATDLIGRHGEIEGKVFAIYAHAKPLEGLAVSQAVKPGDPIGKVIPLLGTRCYASREHVHYELRVNNVRELHINPHHYWVDGPNKPTCFKAGSMIPVGKTVAPVRCKTPESKD
jgi:hypothetical protein